MASISYDPDLSDVDNSSYLSTQINVSTVQVEAKVGVSALDNRQELRITNLGPQTLWVGPSGVTSTTGDILFKNQTTILPLGKNNPVFLITASGTSTVVVQEIS